MTNTKTLAFKNNESREDSITKNHGASFQNGDGSPNKAVSGGLIQPNIAVKFAHETSNAGFGQSPVRSKAPSRFDWTPLELCGKAGRYASIHAKSCIRMTMEPFGFTVGKPSTGRTERDIGAWLPSQEISGIENRDGNGDGHGDRAHESFSIKLAGFSKMTRYYRRMAQSPMLAENGATAKLDSDAWIHSPWSQSLRRLHLEPSVDGQRTAICEVFHCAGFSFFPNSFITPKNHIQNTHGPDFIYNRSSFSGLWVPLFSLRDGVQAPLPKGLSNLPDLTPFANLFHLEKMGGSTRLETGQPPSGKPTMLNLAYDPGASFFAGGFADGVPPQGTGESLAMAEVSFANIKGNRHLKSILFISRDNVVALADLRLTARESDAWELAEFKNSKRSLMNWIIESEDLDRKDGTEQEMADNSGSARNCEATAREYKPKSSGKRKSLIVSQTFDRKVWLPEVLQKNLPLSMRRFILDLAVYKSVFLRCLLDAKLGFFYLYMELFASRPEVVEILAKVVCHESTRILPKARRPSRSCYWITDTSNFEKEFGGMDALPCHSIFGKSIVRGELGRAMERQDKLLMLNYERYKQNRMSSAEYLQFLFATQLDIIELLLPEFEKLTCENEAAPKAMAGAVNLLERSNNSLDASKSQALAIPHHQNPRSSQPLNPHTNQTGKGALIRLQCANKTTLATTLEKRGLPFIKSLLQSDHFFKEIAREIISNVVKGSMQHQPICKESEVETQSTQHSQLKNTYESSIGMTSYLPHLRRIGALRAVSFSSSVRKRAEAFRRYMRFCSPLF